MEYVIIFKKEEMNNMAYYRRIRELREDNGKTQREIAEYLGTPYQYYAVYEKGGSEISFERAIALADYYNVSLDYLAERTNSKRGMSFGELNREEQMLIELISELSGKEKKSISGLLKQIIKIIED